MWLNNLLTLSFCIYIYFPLSCHHCSNYILSLRKGFSLGRSCLPSRSCPWQSLSLVLSFTLVCSLSISSPPTQGAHLLDVVLSAIAHCPWCPLGKYFGDPAFSSFTNQLLLLLLGPPEWPLSLRIRVMFSFVALRRGGFFAVQGIFLQWWAQSHKLFTIYTCPLLLLSAPSCFNKTTSCVSASTLLICPMLNKLVW